MKSTRVLWIIIICLVLSLGVSILANIGVINLSKVLKDTVLSESAQKVLQLSDIE